MAQHLKALAIKPVNLRLLPGIYMMEKKTDSQKLPCALTHTHRDKSQWANINGVGGPSVYVLLLLVNG